MGQIRVEIQTDRSGLERKLKRLEGLASSLEATVNQVALESLERLVNATPVRYTGQTRGAWVMRQLAPLTYVLANSSKVMRYLEKGTKAHGPVTARRLYIPLNQAGVNAYALSEFGGLTYGVDYVLKKKVKGIRARNIAKKESTKVGHILHRSLVRTLKRELK